MRTTTFLGAPRLVAVVLLGACERGLPDDIASCDDAACRQEWMLAHWDTDQERVLAAVAATPAGVERLAVVQALAEANPGQAAKVCEVLPKGSALDRCNAINERPHLWQIDLVDPTKGDMGVGTVFAELTATTEVTSPWAGEQALLAQCATETTLNQCASEHAWKAAMEGRVLDAGRYCLGIAEDQWRFECFFGCSERSYEAGKRGQIANAVSLCVGAGAYMSRCLGHISVEVALSAPAAGSGPTSDWERFNRDAMEVRRVLDSVDPGLGARMTADTWSRTFAVAYSTVPAVIGNPLDVVEPHAVPHVRAAAAWRLVQLEGGRDRPIGEWVTRLEEVLLARDSGPRPAPTPPGDIDLEDHWSPLLEGEDSIQRTPYLTGLMRALPKDPLADSAVCILEAAALDSRKHPILFESAVHHPDSLVRWTAARLMRTQRPSREVRRVLLADPDPLVRARAPAFPK